MLMNQRTIAGLQVLIGASSYGILSTFVKLGYREGFSPGEITGSQLLFGFVAFWLMCLPYVRNLKRVPLASIFKLTGSGLFTGLTGLFYYFSLQSLDASFAVLLLFQFTWMGLLLDWIILGKRPGRNQAAAVAIVLIGTLLASGMSRSSLHGMSLSGIALGLLAAVSYTLNIFFSGKVATEVPALFRSAWMVTGATIVVMAVYPPEFLWNGSLEHGLWVWASILSLFGIIIPPYLFAKGAPMLSTGLASILGAVELPVVLVISGLLLGEQTSLLQCLGIALIFVGIIVSERKPAPAAVAPNNN